MEQFRNDKYGRKRLMIYTVCKNCDEMFWVRKDFKEKGKGDFCSRKCYLDFCHKNSHIIYKCDFCGKEFEKRRNQLHNSKSGLYFCKRECKDKAQRLDSGITAIQPKHYGTAEVCGFYRRMAFENYDIKCATCGWDKDERILEVHHINGDRTNSELENLIILCSICHRGITLKYYELSDDLRLMDVKTGKEVHAQEDLMRMV